MKRHGDYLWRLITDRDNIALALYNAARNVKCRDSVRHCLDNFDDTVSAVRDLLVTGRFHTAEYRSMRIYEPKEREIHILPFFPDRIVQHAIVDIIAPRVWEPKFIYDSYACRVGKGAHRAVNRAAQFVRTHTHYVKYDIRGFYHSIWHDRLKRAIEHDIKCAKVLDIIFDIIDSFGESGQGCPIGNLTSQWFGNIYMNGLDHFVKERLGVRGYVRYCDDFPIFGSDRPELRWRDLCVGAFVRDELGLEFSRRVTARTKDGLDFLGYRVFPEKILLRKSTAKRIRRRVAGIRRVLEHEGAEFGEAQLLSLLGSVASAKGVMRHAQTHNLAVVMKLEATHHDILARYKAIRDARHSRSIGWRKSENAGSTQPADRADAHGASDFATPGAGREAFAVRHHPVLLPGRSGAAAAGSVYGIAQYPLATGQSQHELPVRGDHPHDGQEFLSNLTPQTQGTK